ncbi:MAG: hypothetical protein Q4G70_04060 [Pseudomonadota bacterium]|nr:hypothetical protein [Pseudomonadota bacterium]
MSLAKTEKGREALAQRGLLSRRERQLLILCDAQRTQDDLMRMMGVEIAEDIERLEEAGLLMFITPSLRRVAEFSDTGTIEFPLTRPQAETSSLSAGYSLQTD